jgi:predicted phosphodiesterase
MALDPNKPWVILSDIHANQPAFEAVINDVNQPRSAYDLIFLGDLFGRGPMPAPVGIKMNKLQPNIWLAGNHDKYLVNDINQNGHLNNGAKESLKIHRGLYMGGSLSLCQVYDKAVKQLEDKCLFSHGFPLEDDHLSVEAYDKDYHPSSKSESITALWQTDRLSSSRFWFIGHSHTQKIWWFQKKTATWILYPEEDSKIEQNNLLGISVQENEDRKCVRIRLPIKVLDNDLLIINPGSVGFPRNSLVKKPIGKKIANYATVDWQAESIIIELMSVSYDGSAVLQGWRDGYYPVDELEKYY